MYQIGFELRSLGYAPIWFTLTQFLIVRITLTRILIQTITLTRIRVKVITVTQFFILSFAVTQAAEGVRPKPHNSYTTPTSHHSSFPTSE